MARYTSSYKAGWSVYEVDSETWDNGDELDGVSSATISRDCSDSVPLLESATLNIIADDMGNLDEGWYRIMADITEGDVAYQVPVSTLLLQKSNFKYSKGQYTQAISGVSVLQSLQDKKNVGEYYKYAPKGVPGAQWIAGLFSDILVPYPVVIDDEDDFYIKENFVFSPGDSYLSMAWAILDKYKWCMSIDGDGTVHIKPRPEDPELTIDHTSMNLLRPEIESSVDYSEVYNRYYSITNDGTISIAENNDPSSFLSYQSRGRWIEYVDTSPTFVDGETQRSYTRRRLEETSTVLQNITYVRDYVDGILPFSMIEIHLPQFDIDGVARVVSQSMTFDDSNKGLGVSETSAIEIKGWTA